MSDRNSYEAEPDVEADPHDEDGSYVGRAAADDDFDAGETGAEARGGRHRR